MQKFTAIFINDNGIANAVMPTTLSGLHQSIETFADEGFDQIPHKVDFNHESVMEALEAHNVDISDIISHDDICAAIFDASDDMILMGYFVRIPIL